MAHYACLVAGTLTQADYYGHASYRLTWRIVSDTRFPSSTPSILWRYFVYASPVKTRRLRRARRKLRPLGGSALSSTAVSALLSDDALSIHRRCGSKVTVDSAPVLTIATSGK